MKVETQDLKEFTPVTITITFESEQEICDMWHRMNVSSCQIRDTSDSRLKYECKEDEKDLLWALLAEIAISKNLYK